MQQTLIASNAKILQGKNSEIESAVEDLLSKICEYEFDSSNEKVSDEDVLKLREHYNHFMYQALLNSVKNSLNTLKKHIGSRVGSNILNTSTPFFDVNVQLMPPKVSLSPSLDDIQTCINSTAQAVLKCYKSVYDWEPLTRKDIHVTAPTSFFNKISKDIEFVRVALLLTGCIQGIRNTVVEYLQTFAKVRK